MAKRNTNREQFEQAFMQVDTWHGLSALGTLNDKVQKLIISADDLQSAICDMADQIKIHNFQQISEQYPDLGIIPNIWVELVHLRRLQLFSNLPDEVIQKISQQILGGNNITALRESLITSLSKSTELQAPSVSEPKQLKYEHLETLDSEFMEILNESAKLRNELDSMLWPKMGLYRDAFTFLTGETGGTFKLILDMYHYRNGGWPSEKTPPRFWSVVKRFKDAYLSLDKYGFDLAKNWTSRFGMDISLKPTFPHKLWIHHF
jgi:hypothetical protein